MTMRRVAKMGLATVFFLGFGLWVVWLIEPAPLVFNSSLSAQQASTPTSARPPLTHRKAPPTIRPTYTLVDERIYDAPVKVQVQQHIAVSGVPTEAELRAELLKLYRSIGARRGFRYHRHPTAIYLYIYGTKEQARAEGGGWIGMLARSPGDKGPSVSIYEKRLARLSGKAEDRFGLSEKKRKRVFHELRVNEHRATRKARARFPDSEFLKQFDLESKLDEVYSAELARKYGLTRVQLREIIWEGVTMGWLD